MVLLDGALYDSYGAIIKTLFDAFRQSHKRIAFLDLSLQPDSAFPEAESLSHNGNVLTMSLLMNSHARTTKVKRSVSSKLFRMLMSKGKGTRVGDDEVCYFFWRCLERLEEFAPQQVVVLFDMGRCMEENVNAFSFFFVCKELRKVCRHVAFVAVDLHHHFVGELNSVGYVLTFEHLKKSEMYQAAYYGLAGEHYKVLKYEKPEKPMSERENFKFSGAVSEKKEVQESTGKIKQGDFWVN